PARRALPHLYSAASFRCHPADHRPSGSRHSCSCHGDHSCLTRGGNRADDIGSGKLGTRFALEFVSNSSLRASSSELAASPLSFRSDPFFHFRKSRLDPARLARLAVRTTSFKYNPEVGMFSVNVFMP